MKTARYSDAQIMGILKQAEGAPSVFERYLQISDHRAIRIQSPLT